MLGSSDLPKSKKGSFYATSFSSLYLKSACRGKLILRFNASFYAKKYIRQKIGKKFDFDSIYPPM
jgi:hypothetical protein